MSLSYFFNRKFFDSNVNNKIRFETEDERPNIIIGVKNDQIMVAKYFTSSPCL